MDGVAKIVALSCGAKKGLFSCAKMWFWEDWWYWFDVIHLFIAAWLLESPDLFSSFSYNCIFPLKKNSWRWKSIRSKAIYCFPSEIRTVSASSKPKKNGWTSQVYIRTPGNLIHTAFPGHRSSRWLTNLLTLPLEHNMWEFGMRGYCGFMEALMVRVAQKLKEQCCEPFFFLVCGAFCFGFVILYHLFLMIYNYCWWFRNPANHLECFLYTF